MPSIRKRRDKWQVQIRIKDAPPLAKSFTLKQDAERWAREMEAQAQRGELPANRNALNGMTLACLVKRYRDEVTVTKKGWEQETWRLNAFLRHPICRKKLSSITSADFATYRDDRLKLVKPKSLKTELSPIHNMFEIARDEWGLPIRENPLDKVKLKAVDNRRERRLRDGELERILEAASTRKNPYIIPIILFALETGMRRGEILALRWDDIDFQRCTATIREAKNGYSRVIPLTPKALNILYNSLKCVSNGMRIVPRDYNSSSATVASSSKTEGIEPSAKLTQQLLLPISPKEEEDRKYCSYTEGHRRTPIGAPNDLVFPITANAFRLAWQRTIRIAAIKDLHFHDLRHEAISRFFELGLTVPEVASISGHRDARMLLRYAHAQTRVVQEKLSRFS